MDSRHQLLQFPGLTASTPNEPEVEDLVGYEIGNDKARLQQAGTHLLRQLKSEAILITRGRDGMTLFTPRKPPLSIPIFGSDEVADVTGAGHAVDGDILDVAGFRVDLWGIDAPGRDQRCWYNKGGERAFGAVASQALADLMVVDEVNCVS